VSRWRGGAWCLFRGPGWKVCLLLDFVVVCGLMGLGVEKKALFESGVTVTIYALSLAPINVSLPTLSV